MEVDRIRIMDDPRLRQEEHAAVIIQRFYRNQRLLRHQRIEQAAILLQSHIRKFLAMRKYERLRGLRRSGSTESFEEIEPEEESEQRLLRACLERTMDFEQRLGLLLHKGQEKAATKIQRFYRSQRQQRLDRAAVILQSHIRRFLAMRRYNHMKIAHLEALEAQLQRVPDENADPRLADPAQAEQAARKIQRFYRSHRQSLRQRLDQAATVIQSHVRRHLARRRFEQMKAAQLEVGPKATERKLSAENLSPEDAAVKIQSVWRGFNTRRKLSGEPDGARRVSPSPHP